MKPLFKRVLVSKIKSEKKREDWEKPTFEEELMENTFVLEDFGEECSEQIKQLTGEEVILSDSRGIKVKEEGDKEFFILPQEAVLCGK